MANGDDITWHNESLPWFPEEMTLWQRICCLLGYHVWETRQTNCRDIIGFKTKEVLKLRNQ